MIPVIFDDRILFWILLALADFICQCKFNASFMNSSVNRFYATSLISLEFTPFDPGYAYINLYIYESMSYNLAE